MSKRSFDEEGPDAQKRARGETRVVFVRGLPPDCLESELLALCCPFAVVEKTLLLPQKSQAFVQLPDATAASNLINFYSTRDATIRGKKIFFEYSSRDEIVPNPHLENASTLPNLSREASTPSTSLPSTNSTVSSTLAASSSSSSTALPSGYNAPTYTTPTTQALTSQPLHPPQGPGGAAGGSGGGAPWKKRDYNPVGSPNTILMVSVANIEYDVSVDVLHQVFQKFGNVLKIVTFWKNDEFKALIQMENLDQAKAAQAALDGRDIYTGCNTLSIVFSKHQELKVKYNNERAHDYTDPTIPSGPADLPPKNFRDDGYGRLFNGPGGPHGGGGGPHGGHGGPSPRDDFGGHRGGNGGGGFRDNYDNRGRGDRDRSRDRDRNRDRDRDRRRGFEDNRRDRSDKRKSPVLICSNLPSYLGKADRLFTFFGCFGDVIRAKVMYRKQDTALVQFVDEEHAGSALQYLDGLNLFGKRLRVDYSKHFNVSMPRMDADKFELENTKDYTNSPIHRFRRRSPRDAVAPCPLLHLSGIPEALHRNDKMMIDLFSQHGQVKNFHFIQKNPKMALVEMGNLDQAVAALCSLDCYDFPGGKMRVTFSKSYHDGQSNNNHSHNNNNNRMMGGHMNMMNQPPMQAAIPMAGMPAQMMMGNMGGMMMMPATAMMNGQMTANYGNDDYANMYG